MGFCSEDGTLYPVVKQLYIEISQPTDTEVVKQFLASNGFQHRRNHDYFNTELGLILEDLHDENVLTNNGVLFLCRYRFLYCKTVIKNCQQYFSGSNDRLLLSIPSIRFKKSLPIPSNGESHTLVEFLSTHS